MRAALICLTGVAVFCSPQVSAQTASSAQSPEGPPWPIVQGYAKCLVDQWPGVVQEVIAVFPGSAEYNTAIAPISKSTCLNGATLDAHPNLVRGALFQALYIKSYSDKPPALAIAPLDLSSELRGQPESRVSSYQSYRLYGECVVRSDPGNARALVLDQPGNDAVASLQPSLGYCLRAGTSTSFSKAILTGVIAEVLYRLSVPSWR